jgi:hypothetical protein
LFFLPQNSSSGLAKTEEHPPQQISETTPEKLPTVQANPDDIANLKAFAESYEPKCTKQSVTQSPAEPPEKFFTSNFKFSQQSDAGT